MNNIPCIDCITLPVCKATYLQYHKDDYPSIPPITPTKLMSKCSLVRRYMFRIDRETDYRELVPRNNYLNIHNVHNFFRNI